MLSFKNVHQQDRYRMENPKVFTNKIEPFQFVSSLLALKSYRIIDNHITTVHWTTKLQQLSYAVILLIDVFFIVKPIFSKINATSAVFYIASCLIHITGTLNVTIFWLSNINSIIFIKIMKNFDKIERLVPKMNGFVHSKNLTNMVVHFVIISFISYSLISATYSAIIDKFTVSFPNLFLYLYIITTDFLVYQFCTIVHMISSYANLINSCLCKKFKKPDLNYNYNNNDALMTFLKNKILQYKIIYSKKKSNFAQIKMVDLVKIYDKLMDNLDLTNYKYNFVVSRAHYLY